MTVSPAPFTTISEAQRTPALERIEIIHSALGEGVFQAQGARIYRIAPCKVQHSV